MAIACPVDLDTLKLRAEIQSIYARVAADPSGEFHFHRGPEYAARRLRYDAAELSKIPSQRSRSPSPALGIRTRSRRCRQVPPSSTSDAAPARISCWQRLHVGPRGRAIGVDMTEAMRDRARRGAAACGLAHVDVREGEATALPVETESVDVVISNGVLNLVPDKTSRRSPRSGAS